MSKLRAPLILIFVILLLDQYLKVWIKTNMSLGEQFSIFGNWAFLHFTENNGMAFGWEIGGEFGKMILSIFRILAVIGIGWYLVDLAKKGAPAGLLISFAMIFAGAVGNIIDSSFYGLIFTESSYGNVAEFFPEKGYADFLHGKVVDMFYFPIIKSSIPAGIQFWASEPEPIPFTFFRPVFNIADSSITVGVAMIILFHRKFFKHSEEQELQTTEEIENSVS
ncbi:MAG: lipoprotein signal peptidase [Bacteroidetes bacterium]|nr:MAG: lipoprotein signal peptidase [Bacteroidota bacterium]